MNDELPILTDQQKVIIDANWSTLNIRDLVRLAFADKTLDGRSNEGKAVKLYLATKGQEIATTKKVVKGEVELNDQQKLFVQMNMPSMRPLEMAKVLFPDAGVTTALQAEARAVYKYAHHLDAENIDFWEEAVDTKEYRPPRSIAAMLGLANTYVQNRLDPTKDAYDYNNLKPFEEKCLRALLGYLRTTRVSYQAALYEKKADRTLFESTIVRLIHDKPDLGEGDVDMFVAAAAELVNITREERKILRLEEQLNQILGGDGEDRQKLSQAFVELLNQTRTKWDSSKARYKGFMESLESTRAKRNEHMIQKNQSVLNLLEAWQKDEQMRNDLIEMGEREKVEDAAEVKRLTNMDSVVALIAGHTKDEASN
jgi:flagellar biosynthesis chaperone FliJ